MKKKITEREFDVIKLLYLSNKEIAEKLCVTVFTVKNHIHNLLVKFKAKNRTELLVKVIKYKERNK